MTLDEAFAALGGLDAADLEPALLALRDGWEGAAPRCRALLHGVVSGADVSEAAARALFGIVHLLGEKEDTAAFADLCALAGDGELADLILGDALTETMPRILVSCFDGDAAKLHALAEGVDTDPVTQGSALMVLAYLTAARRIPRTETHAYLAGRSAGLAGQDAAVCYAWTMAVGLLGFGALAGKVTELFTKGAIPRDFGTLAEFRADLQAAAANPGSLEGFESLGVYPLSDAVEALRDFSLAEVPDDGVEAPVVNPLRHVGRNDPCPCGSGKKFKKCCLE